MVRSGEQGIQLRECLSVADAVCSSPRVTSLKGIEDFKGEVVHPAYWTDETIVDNKRVALIGYGCMLPACPMIVDLTDSAR